MRNNNQGGLPTYERSSQVEVTATPDPSGTANMLINSFERFAQGASAISQGITKQAAQEQRSIIKNNISTTYRQFSLEALKHPDANQGLAGYVESSKSYGEQLLQQTDRFNRPYVENLLNYYSTQHRSSVEQNAIMQNKRVQQIDFIDRLDASIQDENDAITNSAPIINEEGENEQFLAPTALHAQTLKLMHEGAQLGFVEPAALRSGILTSDKNFVINKLLKQYQNHVDNNEGDVFIEQLRSGKIETHGLEQKDIGVVLGKMVKQQKAATTASGLAYNQLKNSISEEITKVGDGSLPNTLLHQQISEKNAALGEELERETAIVQNAYGAKQASYYMSPSEVTSLKEQLNDISPDDPDYKIKRKMADQAIKAIDSHRKALKADPMKFIMEHPSLKEAFNDYHQSANAGATGSNAYKNTPFNNVVPKPWKTAVDMQLQLGLTLNGKAENRVKLIDNDNLPVMVNAITTADPHQKIMLMNQWKEEYGGGLEFNLAVKQLVDGGMPPELALLANIDPASQDAKAVSEAFSIPKKELLQEYRDINSENKQAIPDLKDLVMVNVYGGTGSDKFISFLSTTNSVSGSNNREFLNSIESTVLQLSLYYGATEHLDESQAVEKAENVVANRYDYAIVDNKQVRVPKDLTETQLVSFADQMQKKVATFDFNIGNYDKMVAKRLITEGHWENDSVDHGLVWVDASGRMWTDKEGHPLSFSFDEARNGFENPRTPNKNLTSYQDATVQSGVEGIQ